MDIDVITNLCNFVFGCMIFLIVSFLCILYNVLPLFALPVSCSTNTHMRLYILLRIDQLKPAAESLKIKTGLVISPSLKPILDGQPPFSGFPAILSNGNCTDCNHISNCFNYDCVLLEKLMRFMNRFMSTEYRTDIGRITIELNVIREQMGCDAVHVTMPEYTCQNKEMDYMIAKDTVQFIGSLSQRYS